MITWLKEGDANTKYFHSIANGRHNKNCFPRIYHNGDWVEGNPNLGRIFSDHFRDLLGKPRPFLFLMDCQFPFHHRERVDRLHFEQLFSIKEIKRAVFDLGDDKATGPDGFPIFFFQKHWDLVINTYIALSNDFFEGKASLERLNWVNLAVIAKSTSPKGINDFRPISLINSS